MVIIQKIVGVVLVSVCTLVSATTAQTLESWTTDFTKAKSEAAETQKPILLYFTGDDWCSLCIALNKEVFEKKEFGDKIGDLFIPVKLDFPRAPTGKQSEEANTKLAEQYSVKGFPTLMLVDAAGRPFAETGFMEATSVQYLAHLKVLAEVLEKRDFALKSAAEKEGLEQATALVTALQVLQIDPPILMEFYKEQIDQIKKLDPSDETGFIKEVELREKLVQLRNRLQGFLQQQDLGGAHTYVDKAIDSGNYEGEALQQVVTWKAILFAQTGKLEDALVTLKKAREIAPESPQEDSLANFQKQLEAEIAK